MPTTSLSGSPHFLLLEARASGAAAPAPAAPDATTATRAITIATSASPLNLGSYLLFPAQASGSLLLGSTRPLGSTVRHRDPAQGRQTGPRTSVLPWRTGNRKRRYGTELLPLACLLLPAASDPPVSFCSPPESPGLPLSATSHPPYQAPQLPAATALSPHYLYLHLQTGENPWLRPHPKMS